MRVLSKELLDAVIVLLVIGGTILAGIWAFGGGLDSWARTVSRVETLLAFIAIVLVIIAARRK